MSNLQYVVIVANASGTVSTFNAETREDAEDIALTMRQDPAAEVTIAEDCWTAAE